MSTMPTIKATRSHPLIMKVAGGLIKHLGLQMYSGPIPSIAELIANAWDAMAGKVEITIPVGKPIQARDQIVVEDNGHGMKYDEANDQYLLVGRDRRIVEGDTTKIYGRIRPRKVLGRKGIGKLAGFGIASVVEVRTVKNGEVTHFQLDFEKMTKGGYVREYKPDLLADDGKNTQEQNGTKIVLKNLKITRPIEETQFKNSLARRFGILSDPHFSVLVNGTKVKKSEVDFQFRFPNKSGAWNTEKIKKAGTIRWWIGFTEKPISDDEARGIVVFARGKLVQSPWFFDLSGGAFGQHGMQYMTGEVEADFLDETKGEDLIATDRASVLWDEEPAATLRAWGQTQVKKFLKEWAEGRTKEKVSRPEIKKYLEYGVRLPDRERQIFNQYVEKLVSIPQIDEESLLDELVQFGFNALTNRHFLDVIKQINAASPGDKHKIVDILSEWDIIEAVNTLQQVRGRMEVIKKFEEMINGGVPEKPDMQNYIVEHPWLINPAWTPLQHEQSLDSVLIKKFKIPKTKDKSGKKRLDFFCLAGGGQWEVVEVKRPGIKVGTKELQQIQGYVAFLREHSKKITHPELRVSGVNGILIYSDIADDTASLRESLEKDGIHVMDWGSLLRRTKSLHEDFLKIVKSRAPADDPRVKSLEDIGKKNGKQKKRRN